MVQTSRALRYTRMKPVLRLDWLPTSFGRSGVGGETLFREKLPRQLCSREKQLNLSVRCTENMQSALVVGGWGGYYHGLFKLSNLHLQSTLALRTPRYYGHPINKDSCKIPGQSYRRLTENKPRYYGLSLLRTYGHCSVSTTKLYCFNSRYNGQ